MAKKATTKIIGPHYVMRYVGVTPDSILFGAKTHNRYRYGTLCEDLDVDPNDFEQLRNMKSRNGKREFELVMTPEQVEQALAENPPAEPVEGAEVIEGAMSPALGLELSGKPPAKKPAAKRTPSKKK